jgi:hypothetical protein
VSLEGKKENGELEERGMKGRDRSQKIPRIFMRELFPAFGGPTIATFTPSLILSPLLPSFKCTSIEFFNDITFFRTILSIRWRRQMNGEKR